MNLDSAQMTNSYKYKRILLKLSGESFKGKLEFGIDQDILDYLATQIQIIQNMQIQLAIVIGGGNIIRGSEQTHNLGREAADYAGMLATIINGLFLQTALTRAGVDFRIQSAINVPIIAEGLIPNRAKRHLDKNRVVIFLGGTGNPYMSTDTAAALRALQVTADLLIMSKYGVDGVYDSDPRKNESARKLTKITYHELLNQRLQVMDSTAASLCMDNGMPTLVFDIFEDGSLKRIVEGESIGTLIYN